MARPSQPTRDREAPDAAEQYLDVDVVLPPAPQAAFIASSLRLVGEA
ncbi:MAG: hypothetical protein QM622_02705 [Microbacterium sp.]